MSSSSLHLIVNLWTVVTKALYLTKFMHVLRLEGYIGHLTWPILENPKNIVSYQESSSYNLEEFPREITQSHASIALSSSCLG